MLKQTIVHPSIYWNVNTKWLFAFQTQEVARHTYQWLDGSPYTFQNWYKVSPQNTYLDYRYPLQHHVEDLAQYVNPNKLQPQYLETVLCVVGLSQQWIPIPCQQPIQGVTFVCESNITPRQTSVERKIFRATRECPRKDINFRSSCLHTINYVYTQL